MKFMLMHKVDARSEAEEKPTPELLQGVGGMIQSTIQEGKLIDAAGLRSSARRVRIRLQGGERNVRKGPYAGDNELVARITALKVTTMDEAVDWATRLAEAAGDPEVEVGLVTETWDLGLAEKPAGDVPLNVLVLHKASAASEAGQAASATQAAASAQVVEQAQQAGVYVSSHTLAPSARAARIRGPVGARSVFDGPFSESKELIGGFLLRHFDSREQAIAWTKAYGDVIGTPEIDVREVD